MKILVAANATSLADLAVQYGIMLTKQAKADLTIVHVIRRPDEREVGSTFLKTQQKRIQEAGLTAEQILRVGFPAEQIVHLAYEGEFDLVVLGEGSKESLGRRMIAPTNERVIANAPCPVLIVKGEKKQADNFLILHSGQQGLATIVRFLQHAGKLIRKKSSVTLLHVMSQIGASYRVKDWELRAEAAELIGKRSLEGVWLQEGLAALERARKIAAVPKIRHGLVIDEILGEVDQNDYDLVVLGSHHKEGWASILVDDISKQVVAQVKCPVLVVNGPNSS